MKKVENEFIPLPEANTERVRFDLNLPGFIDRSRIGINLKRIEAICKMGGIEHLRVVGETESKTASREVDIVGFTSQGEAFAGKGKTTNVPTIQSDSQLTARNRSFTSHCAEWVNVTAILNIDEIASRIIQNKKSAEGVRSIDVWAAYLDKDIRKAVREKGTRHLLFGLSKPQLFFLALFDLPWLRIPNSPWDFVSQFLIGNFGGVYLSQISARVRGGNPRLSFFFGPELDRAAALQIICRTKTLVKQV